MSDVRLREVMTADPVTAQPSDSLAEAATAMRQREVGSAVVRRGETVVGIVTERDIVRATAEGADSSSTVADWMTPNPVTMPPDEDITHALDRMLDRHFRHIPVVDGEKLVGIVSLRQLIEAAKIRRVEPWQPSTAKGLENVTVAQTELSYIDGIAGKLIYRGYDAVQLALRCSFEDVWYLLYHGDLPSDDSFSRKVAGMRALPLDVDTIRSIAKSPGSFMSMLQACISATGARWGVRASHGADPAVIESDALRIASVVPTIVAALWRLSRGEDLVEPDPELGLAGNYLWMMLGRRPSADEVHICNEYLILTAEHGMNNSTFTSRVVASSGSDVVSCVAAGAAALAGPLHGGAPSLALDMMDQIGDPDHAGEWIRNELASGRVLMGFGHRVYRTFDPRAMCLKESCEKLGGDRIELAKAVEEAALTELRAAKPGRAIFTNVEFYSAVALEAAGIPRELFTTTFAVSRTVGWTANVIEQARDNRIIRPTAEYTGPLSRALH